MKNRYKFSYHTREKIIPGKPKKSKSYVDITDTLNRETKRFQFSKNLGEGTYGYVRLFVNGDDKIAVKALKEDEVKARHEEKLRHLTKKEVAELQENMTSEMTYLQESYPDQGYYWLGHYAEHEKDKNGFLYDCRMIQPFISGKKLDEFASSIDAPEELALLMLRVAEELNRIHVDAGIIHGDAGARNIMVTRNEDDDFDVHFLDFGLAYRADGYAKVNYEKDSPSDTTSGDLAPERFPNRKLKARPAQDVYALAKTFRKLIKKRDPDWQQDFYSKFPVINNFIKSGIRDWKERPDLQEFIHNLQSSLDWKENLPESIQPLINDIENESWIKLKFKLRKNTNHYPSADLGVLLHNLILAQNYTAASKLIELERRIPAYIFVNGDSALHIAAADKDIDPDFFAAMIDFFPTDCATAGINQINRTGDNVIHIAAAAGNTSIIIQLLKQHPDLSMTNKDGLTAAEVAHESVKPIMDFFVFLNDLENQTNKMTSVRLFDNTDVKHHKKTLKAAHWLEKYILTDDVDIDEVDQYQKIIDASPELTNIYQFLVDNDWLRNETSFFSIFNL